MIEIGIISIVVLAVGYWVTLWLMGRRDDVLHGDFVHNEPGTEAAAGSAPSVSHFPASPPFPARPSLAEPSLARPLLARPSLSKPSVMKPASTGASAYASPAPTLPEPSDTLQALLASIKQDLKDASQL